MHFVARSKKDARCNARLWLRPMTMMTGFGMVTVCMGGVRRASWLVALFFALASASVSYGAEFMPKAAVVAFGLYGDQSVFESEAKGAARIVADRFGAAPTIVRSNTTSREDATRESLAATLQSAAKSIDVQNDILFLILTSHGSQAGLEVKAGTRDETLSPLSLVTALNDTPVRHRVVIISACYSGVFIRPLADPNTLVITAADADHTSFGCKNGNDWTYFGDAFFNIALRRTANLRDAFAQASSLIRKRERQRGLSASNPQMAGGENIEHLLKGEADRVITYSREGTGLDPKYAFSRGFAYGARGDIERAIAEYTEAIRFDPRYPIAYNNRGVAYGAKGDNDHAIADYTEAIRLDSKYATFHNNRGLAYAAKGDNDHAIADYTEAIRLDPKLANAYDNRGRAYRAKGQNDRAVRDFKDAIRLDPKLAPELKALGVAL
jgi:Flp pilus assembly protein TadD